MFGEDNVVITSARTCGDEPGLKFHEAHYEMSAPHLRG